MFLCGRFCGFNLRWVLLHQARISLFFNHFIFSSHLHNFIFGKLFEGNRDLYPECAALSQCAFSTDLTPVKIHQFFGERQPDARPFLCPGIRIINLEKTVKNLFQFFIGNPDACVRDNDFSK